MHSTSKMLIIDDIAIAIDKIDNVISLLKCKNKSNNVEEKDPRLGQLKSIKRKLRNILKVL